MTSERKAAKTSAASVILGSRRLLTREQAASEELDDLSPRKRQLPRRQLTLRKASLSRRLSRPSFSSGAKPSVMQLPDISPRRARARTERTLPFEVRLATKRTILDEMRSAGPATTGFDYLRIGLATAVLAWHSIILSTGSVPLDRALWSGPFRFLPAAILPMFFALSGFLVSASLERTRVHQFLTLRVHPHRSSAFRRGRPLPPSFLGPVFTNLPLRALFQKPGVRRVLPQHCWACAFHFARRVRAQPGRSRFIATQLWTIPFEFESYIALADTLAVERFARPTRLYTDHRRLLARCDGLRLVYCASQSVWSCSGTAAHPLFPGRREPLSLSGRNSLLARGLGIASAMVSAILLQIPNASYLAAFPVAYLTVWLGLKNPPRIPFGDLSYGVYLLHFPDRADHHAFLPRRQKLVAAHVDDACRRPLPAPGSPGIWSSIRS